MAYAQLLSAAIETQVYETLHSLLGQIAKDFDLDHGAMVEKYLVRGREGSPPPQFIHVKGNDLSDSEEKPKRKTATKKVTKKVESEDEREGKCTAKTAKGLPCKNKAFGGGCTCRVHSKKGDDSEDEEKPKAKRGRKAKKVEPEHTHKMDELAGSDCELCETHGNPMEGEQEFEIPEADKKSEMIRQLLKEEMGDEIDEELLEEMEAEMAAELEDSDGDITEEDLD